MKLRAPLWLAVALALQLCGAHAQVSVSGSGSSTYSQPIAVPPGIGGMSPNLSLMYAGGGVNGPVGHGWSVQGISTITRCPATRSIDGTSVGVVFGPDDKLCLDGQRLIQTLPDGTPTAFPQAADARGLAPGAVREYRTENDSFARIRAYGITGATGAPDTNGPLYFTVWTKAGQVYTYGSAPGLQTTAGSMAEVPGLPGVTLSGTASVTNGTVTAQGSPVAMVWAASRISDVNGNYIDFKYEQRDVFWGTVAAIGTARPGREWNLAEIQYTGNGSQAPILFA
jgi:hypothetical protein